MHASPPPGVRPGLIVGRVGVVTGVIARELVVGVRKHVEQDRLLDPLT